MADAGAGVPDELGRRIRALEASARLQLEERQRRMLVADPIADEVLIAMVTRLELAGYLPLGATTRVVELVAGAAVGDA